MSENQLLRNHVRSKSQRDRGSGSTRGRGLRLKSWTTYMVLDLSVVYPHMFRDSPGKLRHGYMIERKILHIKRLDLPIELQDHIILQYKHEILQDRCRNIHFPAVMRQLLRTVRRLPHSQSCPVLCLIQFFSPPAMAC